jgi:hypothetical protein
MTNADKRPSKEIKELHDTILIKLKDVLNEEINKFPKSTKSDEFIASFLSISSSFSAMMVSALCKAVPFQEEEFLRLIDYWQSETRAQLLLLFKEIKH